MALSGVPDPTLTIPFPPSPPSPPLPPPPPSDPPPAPISDLELKALELLLQNFSLSLERPLKGLPQLAKDFEATFHDLALNSTTQFLPTPVRVLPSGDETGQFLALDLGGTNLRVGVVELLGRRFAATGGERLRILTQGSWSIPEHLKSSTPEDLFHWVSERIRDVLREQTATTTKAVAEVMELGITFSFPMEQTSHTSALLMPMGKGFTFTHTNDLAALLSTAYERVWVPGEPAIRIVSITNDSVATLLSAAYTHTTPNSRTAAGIIAGTGTNATCMCPLAKLHPAKKPSGDDGGKRGMLLNTEWSINGTAPPLAPYMTEWDEELDASNEKPGFQPLEEMVGGRYLGELVRRVALSVFTPFGATALVPAGMNRAYGVHTGLCSEVEGATTDAEALALLADYFSADGGWGLGVAGAALFRRVCVVISTRAAALVAAATVGVLGMNGELEDGVDVVVGYTGTVLERYTGFKERCEDFMREIVVGRRGGEGEGGGTVTLVETRDGGILGAAVLAAMVKGGLT